MRKHIFYLANHYLTAYFWQSGRLASTRRFDAGETGRQQFAEYLKQMPKVPARVLTDLVEEDFQRESIPHVLGRTRTAMLSRKLGQIYRDTPLRRATMQGREKTGRKDDRVLFSALTNAELVRPWLDSLLANEVPVQGIYSIPLASAALFKKIGTQEGSALLVTRQSAGLRQSYFNDGHLRFSRLTAVTSHDAAGFAELTLSEIEKTTQFLTTSRLMPRGEPIQIVIVSSGDDVDALRSRCQDGPNVTYRLLDLHETVALAKLPGRAMPDDAELCDAIFLSLLSTRPGGSHYTMPAQTRFYGLWQGRVALYAASAVLMVGGLGWTGSNILKTWSASQEARQFEIEKQASEVKYNLVKRSMPATETDPHDMKLAVDLEKMITENSPQPHRLLETLSRALDKAPQIRLVGLQWQARAAVDPAGAEAAAAEAAAGSDPESQVPSAALIGIPNAAEQVLLVNAEVLPVRSDYRRALESVQQMAKDLSATKNLQVELTKLPLDTRPSAKLEGQAGNAPIENERLPFAMKLVWKPAP